MTPSSRAWLPEGCLPRAAACCVLISFCLHQRRWIPSAHWNVTTEHPKKYYLSPHALKRTDIFQQEHSAASLPCSHRNKHQGSWRSHQTHLHTHISTSPPHHSLLSSVGDYRLQLYSDFLLKGFFSCLLFNGSLKQSVSMAKEEGGGQNEAWWYTIPLSVWQFWDLSRLLFTYENLAAGHNII